MESHDNTNIKVSNSFNGNIVVVGGIYVGGVSSVFLALFLVTHWAQAIILSSILIYGVLGLVALAIGAPVAWLWIKLVIQPIQREHSKLKHTQENAIVIVNALGHLEVVPLVEGLSPKVIEADPTNEMTIVDLANHNVPQKLIAEGMHISQSTVSRIIKKHTKEKA